MGYSQKVPFEGLLARVHELMGASLEAYRDYLQNGKTFSYAKELRRVNTSMIDLLEEGKHLLKDDLLMAAEKLLEHYTIWRSKWDELEKEISPEPDDEFVFQNEHTFPKEAALIFERAYRDLLNQK